MKKYIAFIYPEDDGFNAIIPDVAGAYSFGDTFEESVEMVTEALELSLEEEVELPVANAMSYFSDKIKKELDIPLNSIPQVVEYKPVTSKRINITVPVNVLKKIDEFVKKHQTSRSAFLTQSALKAIS